MKGHVLSIAPPVFKGKKCTVIPGHLHHTYLMMNILSTTESVMASCVVECYHLITQDSPTVVD